LQAENGGPIFGTLTDISMGGCYVETSAVLSPGSKLKLIFSDRGEQLLAEGSVTRMDLGSGVAVQFKELNREDRTQMQRILALVQKTTVSFENQYLKLLNRS
jgi:hypothetical protein